MNVEERLTRLIEQHEALTQTMESLKRDYHASLHKERGDRGKQSPEDSGRKQL